MITYPALHWPIALLLFVPHAGLLPWTAVFPDGRFVPSWSRWLVLPSVAVSLLIFFPANQTGQMILTIWWLVIITATLGLLYYRYRIIQEALMNVVRHAQARTCYIRLTHTQAIHQQPLLLKDGLYSARREPLALGGNRDALIEALQIEVDDDGIGLAEPHSSGVGLHSMKERAAELGGLCTIRRRAKGGTRVFVSLPIPREEPDESTSHPYR